MRTTVNLDPRAFAMLKSMATREKRSLGEVISHLILKSTEAQPSDLRNGFPVLPVRIPGTVLTTEDVLEIRDREGI